MRVFTLLAACTFVSAQTPDPAYEALTRAYESLRNRDYDTAIPLFLKAIEIAPARAAIRKDLAYTYLKVGENDLARAQFGEAMRLDLTDTQAAMEYAFLCYESKEQAEARRIFDLVRRTGNPVAEQAFENIDRPLREGIEKWKAAVAAGARNFSAHFELATLADQRDELALAAEHYELAWRLIPDRRSVLVDLGRVWKRLDRTDESIAALLAASRGGEPRAAERARELLPTRYPYVREFHRALELDPDNIELRRELAYLLLKMEQRAEAEKEFQALARLAPEDLLTATQLGFLLYARGEHAAAQPLFDRVLAGPDEDLANRVRAVLRIPQVLRARPDPVPASIDAKVMAERSIKAGYVRDALKYLQTAHEADPGDFDIMLKLGWTLNILRQDRDAYRWFDLARRSSDPQIAGEAQRAWRNLAARMRVPRSRPGCTRSTPRVGATFFLMGRFAWNSERRGESAPISAQGSSAIPASPSARRFPEPHRRSISARAPSSSPAGSAPYPGTESWHGRKPALPSTILMATRGPIIAEACLFFAASVSP